MTGQPSTQADDRHVGQATGAPEPSPLPSCARNRACATAGLETPQKDSSGALLLRQVDVVVGRVANSQGSPANDSSASGSGAVSLAAITTDGASLRVPKWDQSPSVPRFT